MKYDFLKNFKVFYLIFPLSCNIGINLFSRIILIFILAKISKDAFAASALITVILSLSTFSYHFFAATSILMKKNIEHGTSSKINTLLYSSVFLSIIVGCLTIGYFYAVTSILVILKQPTELIDIVSNFFKIYAYSSIPTCLFYVLQNVMIGLGKQLQAMLMNLLSTCLTLIFSYCLAFGAMGLPSFGIDGIGYASLLYGTIGFFVSFIYLLIFYKKYTHISYKDFFITTKELINVGSPIGIQSSYELVIQFINITMIGWIGIESLVIQQIFTQYTLVAVILVIGCMQASSLSIVQHLKDYSYSSLISEIKIYFLISFLLILFLAIVVKIFFNDIIYFLTKAAFAQDMQLINNLFFIVTFSLLSYTFRNMSIAVLRGFLDVKKPVALCVLISFFIGVPLNYYLAFKIHLGLLGINLGTAINSLIAGGVVFYRLHSRINKLLYNRIPVLQTR